ncbi:hypothetical protein FB446DRAFT_791440 [Lentinula raphanica]|nr:hypothetical protein FB446DRAFT_791440 [Lentinula raphanica]
MADIWLKAKDDLLLDMESRIGLMPGYYYPDDEPAALSKTVERLGNVLQHLQNKHNANLNVATEEGQTRNHDDSEIDEVQLMLHAQELGTCEMKCDKCGAHWTQSIQDFNESPGNSQGPTDIVQTDLHTAGSSQGQIKCSLKRIEDSHSKMLQARIWEPKAIRSDQDKQELEKITENQAGQLKTAHRELHDATAMQITPRISEQATQTLSDPLNDLQVQVQQSLENADATIATLRSQNNSLEAELNETSSHKSEIQKFLEESCSSNTNMDSKLEATYKELCEVKAMQVMPRMLEQETQTLCDPADDLQAQLQQSLDNANETLAILRSQHHNLEAELNETRSQKFQIQKSLEESCSSNTKMANKLEATYKELCEVKAMQMVPQMFEQETQTLSDPADDRQAQLQQSLDNAEETLAILRSQHHNLEAELNETRSQKCQIQKSLEESCSSNTKMANKLEATYKELCEVKAMQVVPQMFEQETQTLSDPADDRQAQLQQSLDNAEETLAILRSQHHNLEAELNETRSQKCQIQKSLEESCSSNTKMANKLEATYKELCEVKAMQVAPQMFEQETQTLSDPADDLQAQLQQSLDNANDTLAIFCSQHHNLEAEPNETRSQKSQTQKSLEESCSSNTKMPSKFEATYKELCKVKAMQVAPRVSEQATQTLSDPADDPADDLQTQLQQSLDNAEETLATLRIENNTLQAEVNETRSCKLRMQQSLEETCDSNTKMLQELESVKIDLKSTYERKQELEQTTADQVNLNAAHEELRKVMAMQLEQLETIKIDLETTRRQKEEFEHTINDQAGKLEAASQELRKVAAMKAQMSEQAIQTQLDPPFLSSEDCLELVIRRDELFKCRERCLQLEQSALEATSKYESQQLIQTKIRQAEVQIHQNSIRLLEESLDSLENNLSSREEEVRALRADLTSQGILNQFAAPSELIPNREVAIADAGALVAPSTPIAQVDRTQPLYPSNCTHVLRVSPLSSSASGTTNIGLARMSNLQETSRFQSPVTSDHCTVALPTATPSTPLTPLNKTLRHAPAPHRSTTKRRYAIAFPQAADLGDARGHRADLGDARGHRVPRQADSRKRLGSIYSLPISDDDKNTGSTNKQKGKQKAKERFTDRSLS